MSKDVKVNDETYENVSVVKLVLADGTGMAEFEDVDEKNYATEEFVEEKINNIEHPQPDLSGYATEEFVEEKTSSDLIPGVYGDVIEEKNDGKGTYFSGAYTIPIIKVDEEGKIVDIVNGVIQEANQERTGLVSQKVWDILDMKRATINNVLRRGLDENGEEYLSANTLQERMPSGLMDYCYNPKIVSVWLLIDRGYGEDGVNKMYKKYPVNVCLSTRKTQMGDYVDIQ